MLLSMVAQALSSSYDSIVANWDDISFSSPTSSGSNAAKTLTFTQGVTRTLKFSVSKSASMFYSKNGGADTAIDYAVGLSVTTGDTLSFTYYRYLGVDKDFTFTVRDETKNEVVDTFTVSYTGSGGGSPP